MHYPKSKHNLVSNINCKGYLIIISKIIKGNFGGLYRAAVTPLIAKWNFYVNQPHN